MRKPRLSKAEIAALVLFWKRYMVARKSYEEHQKTNNNRLDYERWIGYLEDKKQAFSELATVLPEIRYTDFWRDVTSLKPEGVIDNIVRYRKDKQVEKELREKEKESK